MIKKLIYPNVTVKNIIYGNASKNKSKNYLKYIAFNPFKNIPNNIYITPTIIANFILNEFTNAVSFSLSNQT